MMGYISTGRKPPQPQLTKAVNFEENSPADHARAHRHLAAGCGANTTDNANATHNTDGYSICVAYRNTPPLQQPHQPLLNLAVTLISRTWRRVMTTMRQV